MREPFPYEVVAAGPKEFAIRARGNDSTLTLDEAEMSSLSAETAAEYLAAADRVAAAANVPGAGVIRLAVKRFASHHGKKPVNLLDVVASVRWMLVDLKIADEVLVHLVRRYSAEAGIKLVED